jgi:hypothetical protein
MARSRLTEILIANEQAKPKRMRPFEEERKAHEKLLENNKGKKK